MSSLYFDNAATSFPKPRCVIDGLCECVTKYCGNPGRSSHKLSLKSANAIYSAREEIASLLGGVDAENIVFTYNATYALNIAIKSLISKNCHVLTSDFEHNSVIRPLESLKRKKGVEYSAFDTNTNLSDSIKSNLRDNTAAIVSSVVSNVDGRCISPKILSDISEERKLILILDASQAMGHIDIDLTKTPCDALCAPGHKALFGIQGCGFVYFKSKERLDSFIEGGSGVDSISREMPLLLPEGYEAGTLSTPAIVSLGKGVEYVKNIGINSINKKLNSLTDYAINIMEEIPKIKLYKGQNGIIAFNIDGVPSSVLAVELDKNNICTRAGLHCAPSIHEKLGTISHGAVRISFSWFNTTREIDSFAHSLRNILSNI